MIKAILFDMDGVLIDSHDAWLYIFNMALKKFEGREISVEEFDKSIWGKAFEKVAKVYFNVPMHEVRDYYNEVYEEYKKRLRVIEGSKDALSGLRDKGIKMVIVSNSQRSIVKRILDDVGLGGFFELLVGGDDVKYGKPEPDILYKGLEVLEMSKDEVLFVGDSSSDKSAAEKAGIRFVGFRIDGDKRVENLKELTELV